MPQALTSRFLFGPGPSNCYLDPVFIERLDNTCEGLRTVWGTQNARTLPLSVTGSGGMEAAFVNTVDDGDVAVIAVNGLFGERMCEVARRCGATVVRVDHEWGTPIDVERVLTAHPRPKVIAAVHAETSTGVLSDVASLGQNKGDALLIVDAVTSIGGLELLADDWGIDVGYAENPRSWYLDVGLLGGYVGAASGSGRTYHHTPPVTMIAGLEAGLQRILAEGLDAVQARQRAAGAALQAGLQEMGLELFAAEGHRLPSLTSVKVADGVNSAAVRRHLLEHFSIEIGSGAGKYASSIWRIGMMGPNANAASVTLVLGALKESISSA